MTLSFFSLLSYAVHHPLDYFGCPFSEHPYLLLQMQNPELHTTVKMFYVAEKGCPDGTQYFVGFWGCPSTLS